MSQWPERIREFRLSAGLTQAGMAVKLGVGRDTLQSWELGRRRPRPSCVGRLCDVLGLGQLEGGLLRLYCLHGEEPARPVVSRQRGCIW